MVFDKGRTILDHYVNVLLSRLIRVSSRGEQRGPVDWLFRRVKRDLDELILTCSCGLHHDNCKLCISQVSDLCRQHGPQDNTIERRTKRKAFINKDM